jgi:hypothetical protein
MSQFAIGSTGPLVSSNSMEAVQGIAAIAQLTQAPSQSPAKGANSDSGTISPAGQMMSQLEQLQQQDPAKLKKILAQIANQLSAAAQLHGPGNQADLLYKLAGRFKSAAQTGDLSRLKPRAGHFGQAHLAHQAYQQSQQELAALGNTAQQPGFRSVLANTMTGILKTLKTAFP